VSKVKRDISFLYEVGSLRNVQRTWRQSLGVDCANDLEHTVRVMWLALILARREGISNEEKVLKMALAHDIAETRTGDQNYTQAVYVKADEDRAIKDVFFGTSLEDFDTDILKEYKARVTRAAQVVKDADNLDVDLELRELAERGSKLPEKWREFRQNIRDEKLYTESARTLWDALDEVDVSEWHIAANKWVRGVNIETK
jgi:putative hydrolases of HD superfamily